MDYFYVAIGGFVIYTALMKKELLIQKRSFRIILLVSVILFLAGVVDLALYFIGMGRYFVSGALLCPLITLAQYRLSRKVFIKYVNREPKDTFFIYSGKDMGKDRLFNILYFTLAFLILGIITGGIERMVVLWDSLQ
ncbi:MAG: hypothetical protein ACRD5H_13755 [Nitrososphaerales archaeon]